MADDRLDDAIDAVVRAVDRIERATRSVTGVTPPAPAPPFPTQPEAAAPQAAPIQPNPPASQAAPPQGQFLRGTTNFWSTVRDAPPAPEQAPQAGIEPGPFAEPHPPAQPAPAAQQGAPAPEPFDPGSGLGPRAQTTAEFSALGAATLQSYAAHGAPPQVHELVGRIVGRMQDLEDHLSAAGALRAEISDLVARLAAAAGRPR